MIQHVEKKLVGIINAGSYKVNTNTLYVVLARTKIQNIEKGIDSFWMLCYIINVHKEELSDKHSITANENTGR